MWPSLRITLQTQVRPHSWLDPIWRPERRPYQVDLDVFDTWNRSELLVGVAHYLGA